MALSPANFARRARQYLRAVNDFLHWLRVRLREDRLLQISGSLTFTTLLALVPVITIALTVFSAFPAFSGFWNAIRGFVAANLVPGAASKVVSVYMTQFAQNAGKLTALGLSILTVTAVMMMLTIERTFNRIWRVQRPRAVVGRVLTYWGVLTIGPLLLGVSLSLTSWLFTQSAGLVGSVRDAEALFLKVVPLSLTCIALAFMYRAVPSRRVETADALIAGVAAGLMLEGMKGLFAAYLKQIPTYKLVYGAFASFPIFLTWLYVSWLIVLIGAELAAALPYLRSGGVRLRRGLGTALFDALHLLRLLREAHRTGAVPTTSELRQATRMPWEECEGMLFRLADAGWIVSAAGDRWVLARDLADVTLADLYREFVFNPDADVVKEARGDERMLAGIICGVHDDLQIDLSTLFERLPAAAAEGGGAVRRAGSRSRVAQS
jgi:membrane protein